MVPVPPSSDSAPDSGLLFCTRALKKTGIISLPDGPPPSAITLAAPAERPSPRTVIEKTPSSTVRPTARLVVVRGERADASFQLLDGKNFVGRTADFAVDIDLDGQETPERTWASRRHAVVTVDGGGVSVEDLHSLNGTFVNRTRLPAGVRKSLKPGDVVQIGTVQLKLVIE